jgi:pyruvate formate lyase activating enzyme
MAVGELVASALKERPFFVSSGGGITLTGGEPASQPAFAYNLLLACRQAGIHTALETTGCATWHVISRFVAVTDLFLYDVKLVDSRLHRKYTGVPNKRILDNLRRLALHGCQIQVRVPCIPGINDSEEHIASLARLVADMGVGRIALLPFNAAAGAKYEWLGREFPLRSAETQPVGHMESLARICHEAGLDVQVGG